MGGVQCVKRTLTEHTGIHVMLQIAITLLVNATRIAAGITIIINHGHHHHHHHHHYHTKACRHPECLVEMIVSMMLAVRLILVLSAFNAVLIATVNHTTKYDGLSMMRSPTGFSSKVLNAHAQESTSLVP